MGQGILFYFKKKIKKNIFRYTKMGWAGNPEPSYDIPSVIADHVESV